MCGAATTQGSAPTEQRPDEVLSSCAQPAIAPAAPSGRRPRAPQLRSRNTHTILDTAERLPTPCCTEQTRQSAPSVPLDTSAPLPHALCALHSTSGTSGGSSALSRRADCSVFALCAQDRSPEPVDVSPDPMDITPATNRTAAPETASRQTPQPPSHTPPPSAMDLQSSTAVAVKGCGRHFRLDFFPLHRFRRGFRCASKGQTATASAQRRADSRRRHRCCQSHPTSVNRTQSTNTINFQQSSSRAALSGAAHKRAPIQQQQLTSATSLFCSFGRAAVEQPVRCVAIGACHSQSISNSFSMLQHWIPA